MKIETKESPTLFPERVCLAGQLKNIEKYNKELKDSQGPETWLSRDIRGK